MKNFLVVFGALVWLVLLAGCATVAYTKEEARVDEIVRPYVQDLVYRNSRDELMIFVVDDLKHNDDWRRDHAKMFDSSDGDKGTVAYEKVGGGTQPLEIRGKHEIYVLELQPGDACRIQIFKTEDRKLRLYSHELKLLEQIDAKAGDLLKKRILDEHPDLKTDRPRKS